MTFKHVEDFIEVISGMRDPVSGKATGSFMFTFTPLISLARYDVQVIESMCNQALTGQALTERQGELACKIILKYKRQLLQKGVDVSPVESPQWRTPLRKMDYSQRAYIQDDTIILKFPFNNQLIDSVREFTKTSQGSAKWNKDNKSWDIALTEYNLVWVVTWANFHQFEIDPAMRSLMDLITETESTEYAIELYVTDDGGVDIRNAADSLRNYIEEHLGGLNLDNIIRLIDNSSILGYTVNPDLGTALVKEFGPRFYNLAVNKEVKINPNTLITADDFASIIDYADATQRWPVVMYEPDLANRMLERISELRPDQVFRTTSKVATIPEGTKYVHTVAPIRSIDSIPLVISSAGMVFGGDKQLMLQRAEKVVYCAADVYNKKSKLKVVDIAS